MRLCGISSHFWLLSPCIRQVTHALLTRPPLEIDQIHRSLNEIFPVRLACVKHAASVHPEPGSNSLIKCLMYSRQPTSLVISRHYCYKKFILLNDDSLKNFRESYVFHCLVIKVPIRRLTDSLFTLSYFILFVNTEFLIYFQILKQTKYSKIFWRYYIVSSKPHTCWHFRINSDHAFLVKPSPY